MPCLSHWSVVLCPQNRGKGGAVSKLMESMAAEEDFEPNQDSSFSEDEHLPRGGAVERPPTPGECPRCCVGSGLACWGCRRLPWAVTVACKGQGLSSTGERAGSGRDEGLRSGGAEPLGKTDSRPVWLWLGKLGNENGLGSW